MLLQGNAATAGCCSKCWRDQQKKKEVAETVSTDIKKIEPTMETPKHHVEVAAPIVDAPKDNDVNNETTKRKEMSGKKKKKKRYKHQAFSHSGNPFCFMGNPC